ncbi:MAG: amino acid permease [Candidatus Nitrosocaldus sp.]|nr:amino acid permease [Candidatus Nitrosocaldus sp.]MDW8275813.1 amino acid permease [Candidatus Nitrosocaldus sp.]
MVEHEPRLVRTLGLLDVVMIGIAAMIGGAMFVLVGPAIGLAGPAVVIAFTLNAVITLFTAMSYAELGSSIPEVGGGYRWIREGLPRPMPFINGWLAWFAHIVATSLYAVSFGTFMNGLLALAGMDLEHGDKVFATIAIAALAYVNFRGASPTGRTGNVITLSQLGVALAFIVTGLYVMSEKPEWTVQFSDIAPMGVAGILAAMALTFIAFEGYEVIVQAGEEVRNPRRNIPIAIFISIACVATIYSLIAIVAIGATDTGTDTPAWRFIGMHGELGIMRAADTFIPFGALLVLAGGMVSMLAALNASIFSSARVALAMGRYYNLPHVLSMIHARNRTPHVAIMVSAGITLLMAYFFPLQEIAKAAGLIFLVLFAQVNAAVINIRRLYGERLEYGFRIPLFPAVPMIGILLNIALALYIIVTQPVSLLVMIVWVAIGLLMYRLYSFRQEVEHTAPLLASTGYMERRGFRVLVPYMPEDPLKIIRYAMRIAESADGEVNILRVITVPYQMPLSSGVAFVDDAIRSFAPVRSAIEERKVPYHYMPRIAHDVTDAVLASVEEQGIDLLVHEFDGFRRNRRLQMLLTCDVLAVKDVKGIDGCRRVLAFYDDEGEHSRLVLKVLGWLDGTERTVVYLSRLEGIEYVNEKDRLRAHGCEVVEATIPDRMSDRWLANLIIEKARAYEPDVVVIPATLMGMNMISSQSMQRVIAMLDCNLIVARHFTIHAMHQAKMMLKRILQR